MLWSRFFLALRTDKLKPEEFEAKMTHISGIFNYMLNELKARKPEDKALIEAMQNDIANKVQIISPETRKSLLQFPIQFTQKIRVNARDWTTQLHKWADFQLHDLLQIDPIYLTTTDSNGDCVLKHLVQAAIGLTMTKTVNYELIEELFQEDMNYAAMTVAGDPESTEPGNAWYEPDIDNKSVIEYLYDFAIGEGEFQGKPRDERLLEMFDKYAERALHMPSDDELTADFDENADPEEDQKAVMQAEQEREHDSSTDPHDIPLATDGTENEEGKQTEKMDDVNGETTTVDEDGHIAPANQDGDNQQDNLSKVLGVLLKLSNSLG
jgi:hypothetical protein